VGGQARNRENIVRMKADLHFWWDLVSAAARATLIYLGSERRFVLLLVEVFCAVVALRAYRAPQAKRWAAIRSQWMFAIRDVFIVFFSVGVAIFGYELMWNQPNQSQRRQFEESGSSPLVLFNRIPTSFPLGPNDVFLPHGSRRPVCVEVRLPHGFPGGRYKLPFKPVAPSPPALYINGTAQRRGIDYTVSDSTIVVNFHPASGDSLSVWYTTYDQSPRMLP
jgi:hypothetical protein